MRPIAVFLATTPSTDPATYWVPAIFVFVAALINIAAVLWGTRLSGRRSDAALQRSIEADLAGRIHERRLDLYGELLAFANKREQHRAVQMAVIKVDGFERLDPFEPAHVFELAGRATALAHASVLAAWDAADKADQASIVAWNLLTWARGEEGGPERVTKAFAAKEAAASADLALGGAIRAALHQEGGVILVEQSDSQLSDVGVIQAPAATNLEPEGGDEPAAGVKAES